MRARGGNVFGRRRRLLDLALRQILEQTTHNIPHCSAPAVHQWLRAKEFSTQQPRQVNYSPDGFHRASCGEFTFGKSAPPMNDLLDRLGISDHFMTAADIAFRISAQRISKRR
jgi:hypothetical protein